MTINPDVIDERALCRKAANGDAQAQESLYRRHAPAVYTLAMRMLCNRHSAEEVLQETFVKVLTKLADFRGDAAFSTWVRRVAVNECLQAMRSPWRRRAEPWLETAAPAERPDQTVDLMRALAALPVTTRAVVWLHDVEGYTHREISQSMGRSVSFSKSRLARGHRQLREQLELDNGLELCMPVLNNS